MSTTPPNSETSVAAQPRNKWLTWLRLLGRFAVSIGVLAWLIQRTEWAPLQETFRGVRWEFWFLALLTYCAAQIVSSVRWQLLGKSVGLNEPLGRYVSIYFIGMFFNLFLPTAIGGDVARAWFLDAGRGRKVAAMLSIVSERLAGLVALLIVATVATLPNWGKLPSWALWTTWGAALVVATGLFALPNLGRWNAKARTFAEALSLYHGQKSRWLTALGLSFVVQVLSVLLLTSLGWSLQLSLPVWAYAVAMPLVTLLTMLPITVNGIGIREGFLVLLLVPSGIEERQAVALGLLWFSVLAAASLLGGLVYLTGGYRHRGRESHGSERSHSDQGRTGEPAAAA